MDIIIRTDASKSIGTGHVMRCLTLADELARNNGRISFVCRDEPGNLRRLIEDKGYKVYRLPGGIGLEEDWRLTEEVVKSEQERPEWLIVDHYRIDAAWEDYVGKGVNRIMVIDDLADREHHCDLILNQNYGVTEDCYKGLLSKKCIKLLGPRYALLRPQFREVRGNPNKRDGEIRRILVFMGGADESNVTDKALRAIGMLNRPDIATAVIIGISNPHRDEIERLASSLPNTTCHYHMDSIAAFMDTFDLCIGASGTSVWERFCIGLPSIVISIAENQVDIVDTLAKEGYVIHSGWHEDVDVEQIHDDLKFLIRHKEIVNKISRESRSLIDGNGARRVGKNMLSRSDSISLRRAGSDDCKRIYEWRNHANIRRSCHDSSEISWAEHEKWFSKAIDSNNVALLIGEEHNVPVGVLRYNFEGDRAMVSVYMKPDLLGQGLGALVLKAGNNWIRETRSQVRKIIAEILPDNKLSIGAFRKAGFNESHLTYTYDLSEEII